MSKLLTFKSVSKSYFQGKLAVDVLKSVDLSIDHSEMIAIIGTSGCGKSTLLNIAGLLDTPDEGSFSIKNIFDPNNTNHTKSLSKIRLNNIGFIYQNHYLLSDFNAQENVAMPLLIKGVKRSDALDRATDLLEKLGLSNKLYYLPGELSGGQQQRIAIARALVNDPKIILADEPTGNLDADTTQEVFQLFLEFAKKSSVAILMVSHNLELAKKMDKSYRLENGVLIECHSNKSLKD